MFLELCFRLSKFRHDVEIDAMEPWMATLHQLRAVEKNILRVPRTS